MRLTADDAVIPCWPPDRLSVEGSMVLIHIGSGIQVHRACTVYIRPSAASEGRRKEMRCGRSAAHRPWDERRR